MSLEEIRLAKIKKKEILEKKGINPYPIQSSKTATCREILDNFQELIKKGEKKIVAGRVRSLRPHGGSCFLHIEDEGGRLQIFLKKDILGEKSFDVFNQTVDIGDFIEVEGKVFLTKTKEVTLQAGKWQMLAKSLRDLPDKWHGLKDKEIRLRKRYLDLLTNSALKERLILRSNLISQLRSFLDSRGFIEVETPILQTQAGGALAKPFKTHLNALDIDVYLRIAPELYLKRLIIGGFEKIYELGRNFRNEGIDHSHNPEFTMLEFYWAYADYYQLMDFTEELFREIIKLFPEDKLKINQFFQKSLPRIDYESIFLEKTGLNYHQASKKDLADYLKQEGLDIPKEADKWGFVDEILKKKILPEIKYPFFLIHHPLALSPLAKKSPHKEAAARFQLIIRGAEIVNAYSELNDPINQKERFENQQERIKAGDKDAHPYDKDFVEALEYGMPPTAGWGMGLDRLVALLTGSSALKQVIAFPFIKPK